MANRITRKTTETPAESPAPRRRARATTAPAPARRPRTSKSSSSPEADEAVQTSEASPRLATPTVDEIRERAYFLYLERGGHHGDSASDWVRAEALLRGESA